MEIPKFLRDQAFEHVAVRAMTRMDIMISTIIPHSKELILSDSSQMTL